METQLLDSQKGLLEARGDYWPVLNFVIVYGRTVWRQSSSSFLISNMSCDIYGQGGSFALCLPKPFLSQGPLPFRAGTNRLVELEEVQLE